MIKRRFIYDIFSNVGKIPCMQEIFAVVEKGCVVSGTWPTLFPLQKICEVNFLEAVEKMPCGDVVIRT